MDWLLDYIKRVDVLATGQAIFWLIIGILLARVSRNLVGRWVRKHASLHQTVLVQRLLYYLILSIFMISALDQMGFEMKTLFGVAGVFTVALGFASQIAASNIISGLFIIGEQYFKIGERIEVEGIVGDVLSLDWLSVKLRKLDNSVVRIPNESILKSTVINHSVLPLRRFDLVLRIGFQEDLEKLSARLLEVATAHPQCLKKPAPELIFLEYTDTAFKVQFSTWTKQEDYLDYKSNFAIAVSKKLQEYKVVVPMLFSPDKA